MGIEKRGYEPKRRNTNNRRRKRIFVISTEGKNKTERLYFKGLNSKTVQVHFSKGGSTDPEGMVSELITELDEVDYTPEFGDKAYCVLDSDFSSVKDKQIAKADRKAKKQGIEVIVSGPCFEIWYLCHYIFSTKQYSSNEEVVKELEKYIPGYSKSLEGMYAVLVAQQSEAIKNARKLEKFNLQNERKLHTMEFMPSSEVYKIIEAVQEVSK